MNTRTKQMKPKQYLAAGGVVIHNDQVLVLYRRARNEVRLPKGHVEPGESTAEAALRETEEESGYTGLWIAADLGSQTVRFEHKGRPVVRTERYFLMRCTAEAPISTAAGEKQFEPAWLPAAEALQTLTFEAEREWVRRALQAVQSKKNKDTDQETSNEHEPKGN